MIKVKFCIRCNTPKIRKKPRGWSCLVCRRLQDKARRRKDPRGKMLWDAKRRSIVEGVPFDLKKEDLIIPIFCPVLGIELKIGDGNATENSPSLDKINPKLGYVKGNIAVMSSRANRIKSDASLVELEQLISYLKSL